MFTETSPRWWMTALVLGALAAALTQGAPAATIAVNSIADTVTANDGAVTLREAITALMAGSDFGDANINAQGPFTGANAFGTNDTITFAIAGSGVHTLTPASQFP